MALFGVVWIDFDTCLKGNPIFGFFILLLKLLNDNCSFNGRFGSRLCMFIYLFSKMGNERQS